MIAVCVAGLPENWGDIGADVRGQWSCVFWTAQLFYTVFTIHYLWPLH